jgi:hypothetical protein
LGGSSRFYTVFEGKEGLELSEGGDEKTPPIDKKEPQPKRVKVDKVQCRHLLVKHKNSRNPSSWRQPTITRSKDEALELLKRTFSNIFARHTYL